jgi:tetratricopeptide (TPR) repeat protein
MHCALRAGLTMAAILASSQATAQLPAQLRAMDASSPPSPLVLSLEAHALAQPHNAANWRVLGRAWEHQGDLVRARSALEQAVRCDPESAAAHCDLARLTDLLGDPPRAAEHYAKTIELAPESDYAREAAWQLRRLAPMPGVEARLASFEVDWLDAPEPELFEPMVEPAPLWLRLELGLLYNSNVQLAPISRELRDGDSASFQAYAAPELEYRLPTSGVWQWGAVFRGYFNANEENFRQFNLRHFEPGVFVERPIFLDDSRLVPRLEYDYTFDAFGSRTLGTRHAMTASLNSYLPSGNIWSLYWTADTTDFRDDGPIPSITSLDGWTNTIGASRSTYFDAWYLSLLRVGTDLQTADLDGSSYSYRGVMVYTDAELPFAFGSLLVLEGAVGYRDYPDFEFTPSRNEIIGRAAIEIRKQLSAHWWLSGTYAYDRFASDNEQFDASRHTTGVFVALEN